MAIDHCVPTEYYTGRTLLNGVPKDCPIQSLDQVVIILKNVLTYFLLPAVGAIFLLMFAIGGIQYISSAGDPQKAEAGKKTLTGAIIGLILVIGAEVIIGLFATILGGGVN